jgi:hypothetical protein
MTVLQFEEVAREPYEDGARFGAVGAYERIDAVAHYAVDPEHPANAGIVDLAAAERADDGSVRFRGEVVVLRPVDRARSNRLAVLDLPNRGRRPMTGLFNRAPAEMPPTRRIGPGDGFLMARGFSLAWCAWQWDVPPDPARMGFEAPQVLGADGRPLTGWMQQRIQLTTDATAIELTDQHVGPLGAHRPIPTADVEDPEAVLYVRDHLHDPPSVVDRHRWRFASVAGGAVVADATSLWVDGGLRAGRVYDLVYRSAVCPVVGTGLLAARDAAAFLRSDRPDNPLRDLVDRIVLTGISQDSRMIRQLLMLGLDLDERGVRAVDGVLGLVGGGRRGEFNHRYAQPSVQPTPSFGHIFPFADLPQTDPRSGRTAGLMDVVASRPDPPKVVFVDTAAEYWRGDAALAHTSVVDGSDVEDAPFVRRYLFSSAQHGPGLAELSDQTLHGAVGANPMNVVDYTPLYRCALVNLVAWMCDGTEPPASEIPRWRDGTAATREDVLARLATVPCIGLPDPAELAVLRPLDLGPDADSGVGRYPAVPCGDPYPVAVSAVDDDGNELAGVRMPDVTVPVATHLGFNPRRADSGGAGQLLEYAGSTVPFAVRAAERARTGDPRPSLEERYEGPDDYAERVRAAAEALVARRLLLADDVELCVNIARRRYALVVEAAIATAATAVDTATA